MKICPRCQKTYNDEGLNFCLDDGATLQRADDNSIPATVMFNQPRPTNPPQQFGSQTGAPNAWGGGQQNQFSMQSPQKKSKTWLLVLGILGGLALVCGGGFFGFVYWAARQADKNSNSYGVYNSNTKTPTPVARTKTDELDLSGWAKGDTSLGFTEYKNGELLMSSKKKNFYYVLGGLPDDKTENATTKITVRNVNEEDTSFGFGLIINSDPKPLVQDYAFLIDSEDKKYRVVRHIPQKEIVVVDWTYSSAIKDGTQPNVLEVRDENKKMNFYVNGEFIRTVNNTDGYSGGVTGIYVSDAIQIAFSKFEISR